MALKQISNRHYSGNTEDKPESLPSGSFFIDEETPALFFAQKNSQLIDVRNLSNSNCLEYDQIITEYTFPETTDGVNKKFTTASSIISEHHIRVYVAGIRLRLNEDYVIELPSTITFLSPPEEGEELTVDVFRQKSSYEAPVTEEE